MRLISFFFLCFLLSACKSKTESTQQSEKAMTSTSTSKDNLMFEKFGSKQILVVQTSDFDAIKGILRLYEWNEKSVNWQPLTEQIHVVVGSKGLAWGEGLQDTTFNQPPLKKEGDKKSPAGIFYISSLFGYKSVEQLGTLKMPYIHADQSIFCVDDINSKYYNHILDADTTHKDWNSAESMLLDKIFYKYGAVVDYNYPNPESGRGSCIFVHIWQDNQHGTVGCTAMPQDKMINLFHLLDKTKRPILIQSTKKGYEGLKKAYNLP